MKILPYRPIELIDCIMKFHHDGLDYYIVKKPIYSESMVIRYNYHLIRAMLGNCYLNKFNDWTPSNCNFFKEFINSNLFIETVFSFNSVKKIFEYVFKKECSTSFMLNNTQRFLIMKNNDFYCLVLNTYPGKINWGVVGFDFNVYHSLGDICEVDSLEDFFELDIPKTKKERYEEYK